MGLVQEVRRWRMNGTAEHGEGSVESPQRMDT